MNKNIRKLLEVLAISAAMTAAPEAVLAAPITAQTSTTWYARIDSGSAAVRETAGQSGRILTQVVKDQMCQVIGPEQNGWMKISVGNTQGYIESSRATLIEKTEEKVDQSQRLRQDVVSYALQFVGNRYVYGGSDPHTGVDCSGFTRYVMRNVAGVYLSHSSRAQASEGKAISYSEAQPGDLIFYGNGRTINHVAIYMGGGQIVHASSARTGIKVSSATSRTPVKAVRVLN